MTFLQKIPLQAVISLSAEMAVDVLRQVFRAECAYAKLSPSVLTISSRLNTPDGGIDAEICTPDDFDTPNDCLFCSGITGFQIKSGSSFKPWTKSSMRGELFSTSGELFSEIQRLLERNGRYVVISTGIDFTPKQRHDARKLIASYFATEGFSSYEDKIDILGASQIAEFIERYPGTASLLVPNTIQETWTISEWQINAHMSNIFEVSDEQTSLINEIRTALSEEQKHIRILGEPGLGKTRIVLEALKEKDLAPFVLYFQDGSKFGQSNFFLHLIKATGIKPLVVVIDELPEQEMIAIWQHLKPRCGNLKIITLDHGRDETYDDEILRLHAPLLNDATIKSILARRIGDSNELNRWVSICEGSPRVAQAVADNLFANPTDLLRPPSTIAIWTRYLHGYQRTSDLSARQIDCVAHHLSLFSRFGYEAPVGEEAKYIAQLIQKSDPSIGWTQFQEIIQGLRARRVLQGHRTLFFVPKALHIYLWKQFWERYGRGFNFTQLFSEMPESLHIWFLKMFKYADASANSSVIEDILNVNGIFSEYAALTSSKGGQFLSILAEANPLAVLRLLEATVGTWSDQELLNFKDNRQQLVWTIEKIAVWDRFTLRALRLLARLAINENADNSNNATGTLIGLFRIGPEAANTEASPQVRLTAMLSLLRSMDSRERRLGLRAMNAALMTNGMGFRIVGVENQGLRERAKLWAPETYGDWWEAKLLYFQNLIQETRSWDQSLRPEVCLSMLEAVEQLIILAPCTELAFQILKELARDKEMATTRLNRFFSQWRNYRHRDHEDIFRQIKLIERSHAKMSLSNRFQKYVIDVGYSEWDEGYRERSGKPKTRSKALVNALARRISRAPEKISMINSLLEHVKHSVALFHFGEQLALNDSSFDLLESLIGVTRKTNQQTCLDGYLSIVKAKDLNKFHLTIRTFFLNQETMSIGTSVVLAGEYDEQQFSLCIDALERGLIEPSLFFRLRYGNVAKTISHKQLTTLFNLLARYDTFDIQLLLIELLDDLDFNEQSAFDADFVLSIVSRLIARGHGNREMYRYHWKNVCLKLLTWNQAHSMKLLDAILTEMKDEDRLSYDTDVNAVTIELIKMQPYQAWQLICQHIEESLPSWRFDILHWLKNGNNAFDQEATAGAIKYLPIEEIFNWISIDPKERSALIANAAPNSLDDENGGQLTRRLITQYGHLDGVKNGISATMHSGGWVGLESMYFKQKREKFRHWLAAGFEQEVIQWIEDEIEYLNRQITRSEIEEERSQYD
ncbi:hypothetical protein [Undibacterium fentianense]|uniref:Uncharacterized protein n=1 Tax=Undibacterium fentianense TaxID=2828728 RepID=A0A941E599_9BURK|nr:hypothetical protein [Undibacterium fentianense]MBR7800879.1 hypothetical protein [Undibacterium fentianense]